MAFVWIHITTANTQSPVYQCLSHAHGAWSCWGACVIPWFCLTAAKICHQCYSLVTAQFYLASKGKYILRPEALTLKKRGDQFWLLLLYVFFCPPFPSLLNVNWASQEDSLFHLRFSLWFSDLPLFHFHGLFAFF